MLSSNITYVDFNPRNPRTPNSALPFTWRFIALVVAYVRHKQAEFKLPTVLPHKWGISRVLDISIHGIMASDGDRVASVRRAMNAKHPRLSIVDMAIGQAERAAA